MSQDEAAVSVRQLTKNYGNVPAVRGVSFEVSPSEVFALLGPNGAGKTSIVEIMEGFRQPDGGSVQVLGFDPANPATSRAMRQFVGVVLQELAVEPYLTVREVLERNASYYPKHRNVGEIIDLVGLSEKADSRVKTLSGGQQRRLDLGLGIVGDPKLLFLDEPTTGFDPSARRDAWEIVRALSSGGATVILTTHYMDEAEALADRVAVIRSGEIVATGTPRSLAGRDVGEATIRFQLPEGRLASELPLDGTPYDTAENGEIKIQTSDAVAVLAGVTTWATQASVDLIGLTVERLTLEDVYLRLTGYQTGTR
ncbi:MAG: ABC transporter ATP-binding protein [Acidimicrobiales bacterium]